MTHLTKPKIPIVNDFTEFKQLFTQEERENTPYTFSNGHLVYIDTTNPDMIAFAESKGLTPD